MITIRQERPEDIDAIRIVQQQAFGQPQEGQLVDSLRSKGALLLSLVAIIHDRIVGHVLYTPVSIDADTEQVMGAGLGPLAVLPEYQCQGIGTMLVAAGNQQLLENACPCIVVLGHPQYYPRFGFKPASGYGIRCEWHVPDEVFMVLMAEPTRRITGLAHYHQEFARFA